MSKILPYILRFGPLVAAFALGLGAVLEPIIPGFTGIVSKILGLLGLVGIGPNQEMLDLVMGLVAGITALVGVARKIIALWTKPAV